MTAKGCCVPWVGPMLRRKLFAGVGGGPELLATEYFHLLRGLVTAVVGESAGFDSACH